MSEQRSDFPVAHHAEPDPVNADFNSRYQRLQGDEIRVLKLCPGELHDTIQCRLEHVSLGSNDGYYALSYVWGDASDRVPMILDHQNFLITKNLDAALRHLRTPQGYRVLWVDAICINQNDILERSRQVLRMGDIYENATCTLIWLGGYGPHEREAVDAAFAHCEAMFDRLKEGDQPSDDEIKEASSHGRVLLEITHRPWFSRVWVIQEMAACKEPEHFLMGPGHPLVFCGHSRIDFTKFILPITLFDLQGELVEHTQLKGDAGSMSTLPMYQLRQIRNDLRAGRMSLSVADQLLLLLSMTASDFQATDERDKIYAILGLLPPGTLPADLRPDYSFSAEKIFFDYAVYILQQTKNLDMLACCSCSKPSLPSWVPDWKVGLGDVTRHTGGTRSAGHLNHQDCHLVFAEGKDKIQVECVIEGTISKVLRPIHIPSEFKNHLKIDFDDSNNQILEHSMPDLVSFVDSLSLVYSYVIRLEKAWFGSPALQTSLSPLELQAWIAGLTRGFSHNNPSTAELYSRLMDIQNLSLTGNWETELAEIGSYCASITHCLKRGMFQDEHGNFGRMRYTNMIPEIGDQIVKIRGATFTFLLRPQEGTDREYRLVGPIWASGESASFKSREEGDEGMEESYAQVWEKREQSLEKIWIC